MLDRNFLPVSPDTWVDSVVIIWNQKNLSDQKSGKRYPPVVLSEKKGKRSTLEFLIKIMFSTAKFGNLCPILDSATTTSQISVCGGKGGLQFPYA